MKKARIAVFVSGGGTNLQALMEKESKGLIPHGEIVLVLSNKKNAYALERAKDFQKKALYLTRKTFEQEALRILEEEKIDMIVLAGFLSILSQAFVNQYENRIINVHPSLIPAFSGPGYYGLKVHEKVLERGVKVTGATVHLVNAKADEGPILLQKVVEVKEEDSPLSLQKRVMEEAEWLLLPQACEMLAKEIVEKGEMMKKNSLAQLLQGNTYPGRGIFLGLSKDGKKLFLAYFIMGRSKNSQNRVFQLKDHGLFTETYDPSLLEDPKLIIYRAMDRNEKRILITNGDQTDTILAFEKEGKSFEEALMTREFEPDGPNWTPRISAIAHLDQDHLRYTLSILKAADQEGSSCRRQFFHYEGKKATGHFLSTYIKDGNPLPSFQGEPIEVSLEEDFEDFANGLWEALDPKNKVSLYVLAKNLERPSWQEKIWNQRIEERKEQ